jgi:CyaY protein
MDDQEFRAAADQALSDLAGRLAAASDRYGFEPDFHAGALTIEFDEPQAKFVVSPNSPVRQIWVSAHSRSFKLDWDAARGAFVLPSSRQTLAEFMAGAIGEHIGEDVEL